MKKLYSILALILVISMLAACGNDKEETEGTAPSGEGTVEEQTPSETDDSEDAGSTDENTNESETPSPSDEIQILQIGETALISSTVGDYEVTPESINFVDSVQGYQSRRGSFVEAKVKMENLSDKPIDIYTISNSDGRVIAIAEDRASRPDVVEIAEEVEEIQPKESVNLTMYFDSVQSNEYHLVFGDQLTSNEVHWEFSGK